MVIGIGFDGFDDLNLFRPLLVDSLSAVHRVDDGGADAGAKSAAAENPRAPPGPAAPYPAAAAAAAGEDLITHPRELGDLSAAGATAFDGAEPGVADLLRDPDSPSKPNRGGLQRSSSVPQTREKTFAEKEKWRLIASIPTQEDFPHCSNLGWDAKRPSQPPIYTLNPLTHTVDKFQQNRKKRNDMEKTRTNRYTRPTEPSIKDAMKFNRLKGVAEYVEILKLGDPRNRAYHRQINKNERVFRRSSGAGTCFVDLMIRQGERLSRPGTRIRT